MYIYRVDGHRMAYGYNPSMTKDNKCGETEGLDELAEVCREMMRKIGAKKELWAAFVSYCIVFGAILLTL